ncbi:MAG: hypothetical protein HQL26_05885 [Candidatus Omnitrophica bacterium]|nr:hypothetical protein [Candidatus Omnitrophota bacterium]
MNKSISFLFFSVIVFLVLPSLAHSASSEILASRSDRYNTVLNQQMDEWEQVEHRHSQMAAGKEWSEVEKNAQDEGQKMQYKTVPESLQEKNVAPVKGKSPSDENFHGDDAQKMLDEEDPFISDKHAREAALPPLTFHQKHTFEASYDVSHYKYEEPQLMQLAGAMNGFSAEYVYRPNKGDALNFPFMNTYHLQTEFNWSIGNLRYESAQTTDKNKHDFITDDRGLIGREFVVDNFTPELYAGFGYRYLNDQPDEILVNGYWDYQREQTYYYLPIGFNVGRDISRNFRMTVNAEYDWLLVGKNTTHSSDYSQYVQPPDLPDPDNHFTQDTGFGLRGYIEIATTKGKVNFFVRPFFEYWHIDDSDLQPNVNDPTSAWVEPENKTWQAGAKFGARF